MTTVPAWLTARPVAHRGLHDAAMGRIENTLGAVSAAIGRDFAIEVDVQLAACGEAMVFHDFTLDRLTTASGALVERPARELKTIPFRSTPEFMPTLPDLLALVAGRVPIFIEIKSRFDGAKRLVERVVQCLKDYRGPIAVMSFDPQVVVAARAAIPGRPIGIISEVYADNPEWAVLAASREYEFQKYQLSNLNHVFTTEPHFIAYNVKHLPSVACATIKGQRGLPILTWTVRTPEQRATAAAHADQMIFEGFVP